MSTTLLSSPAVSFGIFPAPATDRPDGSARVECAGTEAGAPSSLNVCSTPGAPVAPTDWQTQIANDRLVIAQKYEKLLAHFTAEGRKLERNEAVSILGVARTTLDHVITLWLPEDGKPQRDYNALIPPKPQGRPSALAKLGLSAETIALLAAEWQGLNLDTEKDIAALRGWAKSNRVTPELEPVADLILKHRRSGKHAVPESIRELARVSKPARDRHRGPRTSALGGIWIPRRIDILPGDIRSSDDTTAITAVCIPWITSEDYPFGIKVMQVQHFPIIDVASQCVEGFALVARESSSYRGADLWHGVFGNSMRTVGVPRLGWQLERGTWESHIIAGETVEWGEEEGDVSLKRRVGGLRQLPSKVTAWHRATQGAAMDAFPRTLQTWTSFLPKSKSVEALINRTQTFEGTIFGSLGRDQMRRPYEKAKKLYELCKKKGARVDGRHHFLMLNEYVARLRGIYDYVNNERMEGEVFKGVPWQIYHAALEEHPLDPLPEEQQWLYAREWRVVTITDGWARVRLTHPISGERYSLFYENAGVFAGMEGEKVLLYFDREKFEDDAQIISCRSGEHVCSARYFDRVGSFLDGDRTGHEVCKAWRNAVTIAYAAMVKHAPSRQLPPEIAARRAEAKAAADTVQISSMPTGGGTAERPPSARRQAEDNFRDAMMTRED